MAAEVLTLKQGEAFTYYSNLQDLRDNHSGNPYIYAARLVSIPELPYHQQPETSYAIVCARLFGKGWCWVDLFGDTKMILGENLESIHRNIPTDPLEMWVFFTISQRRG